MKRVSLVLGLLLGVVALGCDDDEAGGTTSTSSSVPGPTPQPAQEPEPSPATPIPQGNDFEEDCPSGQPDEGEDCNVNFMVDCEYGNTVCNCVGFGDNVWACEGDSNDPDDDPSNEPEGPGPSPDVSENSLDCPSDSPSDGTECSISFLTDCNYDGSTCNCVGGSWSCGGGDEPEPSDEPSPEPGFEPEPEPDSAPFDAGPPSTEADSGGSPPDSMNPESCPRQEPETDECDIDNVGFGTECQYGYRLCTCGGFPGEGVWSCEYEFPPNPESCPDEAPADSVCDIDSVGFGTECRFGGDLCVCGGFPGAGEWQCREALTPEPEPESEPEALPDAGVAPDPEVADAG